MKKVWLGILATLLVVVFVAPSFAWEFSMTGDMETRFRYFGRADGSRDLFGDMNVQNSPLNTLGNNQPTLAGVPTGPIGAWNGCVGFAGPNFYRGYEGGTVPMQTGSNGKNVRIVRSGFSLAESDAFQNDMRMTINPTIRVNNAIRVAANVDFAGTTQKYNHRDVITNGPLNRWYQDRVSENAFDTAMIPSINQLKLTAQMPWGVFSYGLAKDFPFGTGAILAHNTRASALVLVVPYGPFRILGSIWLARNTDGFMNFSPYPPMQSEVAQYRQPTTAILGGSGTMPGLYDTTQVAYSPGAAQVSPDSGVKNRFYWAPAITYSNGPLELYAMVVHQGVHAGQNYMNYTKNVYNNGVGTARTFGGLDIDFDAYIFSGKYNNGRFFANAEYAFGQRNTNFLPSSDPVTAGTNGCPQLNTEAAMAFAEAGALCGPAKLGLMFAWSGGLVLNTNNPTKSYAGLTINYQATDPYNYLLFKTYGGGNDAPWASVSAATGLGSGGISFTIDENGHMHDAYALAARLDYAAAANLNLYGSYLWAHRVEQNGFFAGGKSSGGTGASSGTAAAAQAWKATYSGGAAANMNPFVDDGYLGWEANLGVDWKLLENLSFKSRYAYWQPGPWFDQAYRVVGLLNGAVSADAQMTGRSAIQAFEGSVVVDF